MACVDKNCGWFILSILFKKVVFLQLDGNGFGDSSRSNKDNGSSKSKIESGIKEGCKYGKDKKLL